MSIHAAMPEISRALARGDQWAAYELLSRWEQRERLPRGTAGRALLALSRTEPTERLRLSGQRANMETWQRDRAPRPSPRPTPPVGRRPRTILDSPRLTGREREVIELAAQGLTADQTAAELGIRPMTVRTYRRQILRRLGARNMAHALTILRERP